MTVIIKLLTYQKWLLLTDRLSMYLFASKSVGDCFTFSRRNNISDINKIYVTNVFIYIPLVWHLSLSCFVVDVKIVLKLFLWHYIFDVYKRCLKLPNVRFICLLYKNIFSLVSDGFLQRSGWFYKRYYPTQRLKSFPRAINIVATDTITIIIYYYYSYSLPQNK